MRAGVRMKSVGNRYNIPAVSLYARCLVRLAAESRTALNCDERRARMYWMLE